jgi:hypothetical protein
VKSTHRRKQPQSLRQSLNDRIMFFFCLRNFSGGKQKKKESNVFAKKKALEKPSLSRTIELWLQNSLGQRSDTKKKWGTHLIIEEQQILA